MLKRLGVFVVLALLLALATVMPAAAQGSASEESRETPAMQAAEMHSRAAATYYIVRRGDTLSKIAARFGTTVSAIMAVNPQITNPNRIYAGQRLLIPGTPTPTSGRTRINFATGATNALVTGSAPVNGTAKYVVKASAGQWLMVDVFPTSGSAILIIWGANGDVLISDHAGATSFRGQLHTTQDYYIDVRSVGSGATHFTLQVIIPQRISFAPGTTSKTMTGSTLNGMHNYVAKANAGQTMTVNLTPTSGDAILVIYGADGNVLISDHAGAKTWTGVLPTTQDYFIDVHSAGGTTAHFSLKLTIH